MNDVVLNVYVHVMDEMWKKLPVSLITGSYNEATVKVRDNIRRGVKHKVWVSPWFDISGALYNFEFKEL